MKALSHDGAVADDKSARRHSREEKEAAKEKAKEKWANGNATGDVGDISQVGGLRLRMWLESRDKEQLGRQFAS